MRRWPQGRAVLLATAALALAANCTAQAAQQAARGSGTSRKASASRAGTGAARATAAAKFPPADPAAQHIAEPAVTLDRFTPKAYLRNIAYDQQELWSSPARFRTPDTFWLAPMVGIGGVLLATDSAMSRRLSNSPTRLNRSSEVSNAGVGALLGGGAGLYLWGALTRNPHEQETGFLSMESLADALIVNNVINLAAGRERPGVDNSRGRFWVNGRSFPSNHAVAAWSVAGIIAHEYPGPLSRYLAYGLAAAVSASRVSAKQHFPADVFVGSALGWLVAQEVYRAHHDPEFGGTAWNTFGELNQDEASNPANFGSPYLPLDNWVYSALERLAAMGYVRSEMLGMRPWTRLECARLVEEAQDRMSAEGANPPPVATKTLDALLGEFHDDLDRLGGGSNRNAELESLYARVTEIGGTPLTDGYHFAQTIVNDSGRPYETGASAIAGFSGWASDGPLVGYVDGEYQHAPSAPPLPASARSAIGAEDSGFPAPPLPPLPPLATATTDRFRVVDGYVGMAWEKWQITAGPQSLWWGPGQGGSMMFSDNAQPVDMIQITRVSPFKLPGFLGVFGPIRVQYFLGRLSGHQFTYGVPTGVIGEWGVSLSDQPMIQGEKVSFKPTPNLEFGFDYTGIFAGAGVPFTASTYLRSLVPLSNGRPGCFKKSAICPTLDPGDGRTGFDMSYRLPFLRNWATFYADTFSDDQVSPIAYLDRSANSAGLYFSRLPKLPQVDFRVEGVYSDVPIGGALCCGFFYFNGRYRSGYTNDGRLLGSWIGRDGQGAQAWLTWWHSPQDYVQLQFRHQKVSQQFVPDGGTLTDAGVQGSWWLRRDLSFTAGVQYERWIFPVLAPGQQTDVTGSFGVTFWPRWKTH